MELWLIEVKRVREDMEVAGLSERWRGKSVCVQRSDLDDYFFGEKWAGLGSTKKIISRRQ